MPEGAIKGIAGGAQGSVSLKQQGRIEGAERSVARQEGKANVAATKPDTGGGAKIASPEGGAGNRIEGVRAGAENSLQRQAKNSNDVGNTAEFKPERGQNINEVV